MNRRQMLGSVGAVALLTACGTTTAVLPQWVTDLENIAAGIAKYLPASAAAQVLAWSRELSTLAAQIAQVVASGGSTTQLLVSFLNIANNVLSFVGLDKSGTFGMVLQAAEVLLPVILKLAGVAVLLAPRQPTADPRMTPDAARRLLVAVR